MLCKRIAKECGGRGSLEVWNDEMPGKWYTRNIRAEFQSQAI